MLMGNADCERGSHGVTYVCRGSLTFNGVPGILSTLFGCMFARRFFELSINRDDFGARRLQFSASCRDIERVTARTNDHDHSVSCDERWIFFDNTKPRSFWHVMTFTSKCRDLLAASNYRRSKRSFFTSNYAPSSGLPSQRPNGTRPLPGTLVRFTVRALRLQRTSESYGQMVLRLASAGGVCRQMISR
jgi:hypothetical protein